MDEEIFDLNEFHKTIINKNVIIDCEKGCFNCRCYKFCDMKGNGLNVLRSKLNKYIDFYNDLIGY